MTRQKTMRVGTFGAALAGAAFLFAGCTPDMLCDKGKCCAPAAARVAALDDAAWAGSEWISVKDCAVVDPANMHAHAPRRAADGTSVFERGVVNRADVKSVVWMSTGLGVYELFLNGRRAGCQDALKPGFTSAVCTKRSFTYDVTSLVKREKGARNVFAAEVSAGWWRDKIVHFKGRKSAFRCVIRITYEDGTAEFVGTRAADWSGRIGGPVTHAAIFDGEEYDARIPGCAADAAAAPGGCEKNTEFTGDILASDGAEIRRRCDLALAPVEAYCWKGVTGEDKAKEIFGTVVKTRTFTVPGPLEVAPGETLVVDFGQNCAAVPRFVFEADEGTVLTCLPAEMLNDANGEKSRGNDGPAGSAYRLNLRCPKDGMRVVYTFGKGGEATYVPHYTFFGYRYVSVTATDRVKIKCLKSVPVTSISKCMELGSIETGDKAVNRLIKNVYWGQLSNYLSVPTDCPQRNERLGWTADTQVFCEAGSFNANTAKFFHKWMRDMRDSQGPLGGFPGVAPSAQYGNETMRIGWSDAGVIVPYVVWKQFGDTRIIDENWAAMVKFVDRVTVSQYRTEKLKGECKMYQWADWLSFEKLESAGGAGKPENSAFEKDPVTKSRRPKPDAIVYWDYLGGCYWTWDARMMATMAEATGRKADAAKYRKVAEEAKAYMIKCFFASPDGMVLPLFRDMQTPALFALKLGFVTGAAREKTIAGLKANIKANGGCLQTGFLGTSILMDTLTENGMVDVAYDLLLNHGFPGWLYSVDQGATTIWERWNSYTKDKGFGPVGMNSFNHYAYGAVLAWLYKTGAGIAANPAAPGFRRIIMAPKTDARLGLLRAQYKTPHGVVKSTWIHAKDGRITWSFTVPEGTTALVTYPWGGSKEYGPGDYSLTHK